MRACAQLIVVGKDDIYEKGRLYSLEFMQIVLLGEHAVYKFQTIIFQCMDFLPI